MFDIESSQRYSPVLMNREKMAATGIGNGIALPDMAV